MTCGLRTKISLGNGKGGLTCMGSGSGGGSPLSYALYALIEGDNCQP